MKFSNLFVVFALFLYKVSEVQSANILGVFGVPLKSHQMFLQTVWKELALRGHNVTVMTTMPLNDPSIKSLKEIDWSFSFKIVEQQKTLEQVSTQVDSLRLWTLLIDLVHGISEEQLKYPATQAFLNDSSQHFDLVMTEFVPPAFFYFSELFNCPLVQLTSLPAHGTTLSAIGNPYDPLINPDVNLPFGNKLSILQKVISLLYTRIIKLATYHVFYPNQEELVKKYMVNEEVDLVALERRKTSFVVANTLPVVSKVYPAVPMLLQVHGIHLTPSKPLPQDVRAFLDDAVEGAIFFSLGTSVKVDAFSLHKFEIFEEVLSELPYKVVWKRDVYDPKVNSNKTFIRKWFPSQQDILRHPNVKLFITQGGLQSVEEAIAYEVPMLGIPIFGDQLSNVRKLTEAGVGLQLDFYTAAKEDIKAAVIEIMENERYTENIRNYRRILYDRPMKPLDEVIWWIEYVIRHKGASHLRSPYLDMHWYEYYLIDVFCVIILFIAVLTYMCAKIFGQIVIFTKFTQKQKSD